MKQGSSRISSPGGFTIVETLIVLAVTGFLFVAIIGTLSGRQGANEFTQAINNVQTQIQQTISQVQSGYYQNSGDFHCASTGTVSITAGSTQQGANATGTSSGCVFLGKAIQFHVHGTDPEQFTTFSLAGFIGAKGLTPALAFQSAHVTPIYRTTSAGTSGSLNPNAPTDDAPTDTLMNGLTTLWMKYDDGVRTPQPAAAVAFVMELGSLNNSSSYTSGSQPVDLLPLDGALNQTNQSVADALNSLNPTLLNVKNGVQICFVSGTTNESGLITIGGNGGNLTVDLQRKSNQTCS